jgi:hypothetical protein
LSADPALFSIPKQTYAFDKWIVKNGTDYPCRLDRLYREFIIRKIPATAHRWVEKTPKHIRSLDKILKYFNGKIKVVHIIRDGRDVVTSTHPAYINKRVYWVSPERWYEDVIKALSLSKTYKNIYNIKYEDLITNYENEIEKLCQFLDEPYVSEFKEWTVKTQIKKSVHWGAKVQEIHTNSLLKWKKKEHEARINEFSSNSKAIELLRTLGYE